MQNSTTILGIIEIRLRGISYDDCRSRYGVGNSTVNLIMSRYWAKGVPLEVLKQMPGPEVEASFYPPSNVRRKSEDIMPDFGAIYDRIHREGSKANLYFMWLRYKQAHPSGYQYTQFCHYFNQYVTAHHGSQNLRMAVERVPGERVYIDWVGDQPEILVDSQTGEVRKAHIFVTTVGVSSMIYAEAFPDEKLPSFIAGTVHALDYYGAVPRYLVPDNLRAAVTKHTKDELILNSACQKAGIATVPALIYALDRDAAAIALVDSNLHREKILPSEKAFAYKLKMDAMSHQGTSSQLGTKLRTDELIAQQSGESRNQVQRYIRLTELIPEILRMVDDGKIALTPAVELSYLTKQEQADLLTTMESEDCTPSLSQAIQMKKLSQLHALNMDRIFEIMTQPKANQQEKISFRMDDIRKYFPKSYTPARIQERILKLVEADFRKRQRNRERSST